MTKSEFLELINDAFAEGTPFIDYTAHYSYALIPKGGEWIEVSYDFEDHEILENRKLKPVAAFNNFCEEVEKALAEVLELFYLNKWRDFKSSQSGNVEEDLPNLIKELVNNTDVYGKDIPIIKSPDELDILREKL